ncbi:MAG: hypothetical protein KAY24_17860, partial [Candidatus Eisenbacteria sp.]|nr:hypothetical protein [Candidatus Eisenbacteria bacterium]
MDHPERDCQPTGHLDRLIALLQRSQTASSRDARLHWAVLLWLVLCWLGTSICLAGPNPAADKLLEEKLEPWCYHLYQSHAVDTLLAGSHARCSPGEACLPLSPFFHVDLALLNQGYLRVQLDTGPGDAAAADLQAACEARVPSLRWEGATGQWGQATLAIADLPRLAEVSGLFLITRPPTGLPLTTSEGVEEIGAEAYHALKLAGSDICVGVLDIGFTGADDLLGVELPADTRMSAFAKNANGDKDLSGGGSVHGTACAEIVHDIAPAAALCLANAGTIVEMEMAIHWLQDQGVSVISHSVGWFWGPGDGTGTIVDLTHEAIDAGILWVNAAGNQATRYWGGPFRDTNNDGWHEFDEAGDETITEESVAKGTAFTLVLTWDRWPYSPDLSFQIEIRENGRLVASSEDAYTSESY